jgi:hypothetical protein
MKNADSARYIGKKMYSTLCKVYNKTLWTVLCSFVNYKGNMTTNEVNEDIFHGEVDKHAFESMCEHQLCDTENYDDMIKKFEVSEEDFRHHSVPGPTGVGNPRTSDKRGSRRQMPDSPFLKLDLD